MHFDGDKIFTLSAFSALLVFNLSEGLRHSWSLLLAETSKKLLVLVFILSEIKWGGWWPGSRSIRMHTGWDAIAEHTWNQHCPILWEATLLIDKPNGWSYPIAESQLIHHCAYCTLYNIPTIIRPLIISYAFRMRRIASEYMCCVMGGGGVSMRQIFIHFMMSAKTIKHSNSSDMLLLSRWGMCAR